MPELIRPAVPTALSKEEVQRVFRLTNDNLGRVNERLRGYDYALTHGVELQVEKPVSYTVSKALAVRSYDESTGAEGLPVESLTVREVNATTLGITARFAPPYGVISIERTTNLAITNATLTAVQFSSASVQTGGLSWTSGANTRLVCAHAGTIAVTSRYAFDTAGAGYRQCYINRAGVTSYFAESLIPGGSYAGASGAEGAD